MGKKVKAILIIISFITFFTTIIRIYKSYCLSYNIVFYNKIVDNEKIYLPKLLNMDELNKKSKDLIFFDNYFTSYTLHFFPGLFWIVFIPLQFYLLNNNINIHKYIGYVLYICSSFISISGIIMPFLDITFSSRNIFNTNNNSIFLGIWFFYTITKSIVFILNKDIKNHKKWIIRHIFAGHSVSIQRIIYTILGYIIKNIIIDIYDKKRIFGYCGCIGTIICLLSSELYISFFTNKKIKI